MISFELDVENRKMIVHGDDTMGKIEGGYHVGYNPTCWGINYLRNYTYRAVNQLVSSRNNVFLHIGDNSSVTLCNGLFQKINFAHNPFDLKTILIVVAAVLLFFILFGKGNKK